MTLDLRKPWKEAKHEFERAYVIVALTDAKGNVSKAARIAEKDRKDFYQVMKRVGVDAAKFRQ